MKLRTIFLFALMLSSHTLISAEVKPIKIGGIFCLTGEIASGCNAIREGAEVALDQVNQNGGINGRPLELDLQDSHYTPKGAHSLAVKFANRGDDRGADDVGGGDAEDPVRGCRIEIADRGQALLDGIKGMADGDRQGDGRAGGRDALPRPVEQGISGEMAQALERAADRGLGHAQLLGRAADAALRIDGVEHQQEIEVETFETTLHYPIQLYWI